MKGLATSDRIEIISDEVENDVELSDYQVLPIIAYKSGFKTFKELFL